MRPLTWLTTVALLTVTLIGPAAPARAQGPHDPRLAIVEVSDQTGLGLPNLAQRAATALNERFASSGLFHVIGQDEMRAALQETGVRLPLRPDQRTDALLKLGRASTADYLVTATLDSVALDADTKDATIRATISVFSPAAEGDVALVDVVGTNVQRVGQADALLDSALEQLAVLAVRTAAQQVRLKGRVAMPPIEETIRVSFDQDHVLRIGDILAVLRNNVRIATLKVLKVDPGTTEARIIERTRPEYAPMINDEVVLVRASDQRFGWEDPDLDPLVDVPPPREKRAANTAAIIGTVVGIAAITLGILAFARSSDRRDDARTPALVSPPDGANLQLTSSGTFASSVNFTATSVIDADSLTFQLASEPTFQNIVVSKTDPAGQDDGAAGGTTAFLFEPGDATLTPGTYYWRVIAVQGTDTHYSNVFSFNAVGPGGAGGGGAIGAPTTVRALPSNGAVEVQWSPVAGAAGYQVWRRVLTPRAVVPGPGRVFRPRGGSDAWLASGGLRSLRSARGDRRRALSGRQDGSTLAGFTMLTEVGPNTLSYTDTSAQLGVEYQYVVLAKDAQGNVSPLGSAPDGAFATATPLSTAPPATPSNLTAVPGDNQVTLTWSANAEQDLAGYQVFRSTSPTGNFDDPLNLVTDAQSPTGATLSAGPGDVTVVDRGLTNGVTVYYRIRAVQISTTSDEGTLRGGLESPLSEPVQATPQSAPAQELQLIQPANQQVVDTDRPLFSWRGVEGASQYTVQIATDENFQNNVSSFDTTGTSAIYPSNLPALQENQQYYVRIGVFNEQQQQLRFGPTTQFTRGAVQRYTTTVTASLNGQPINGARISIDGADSGELTPEEFILAPKSGNQPYVISAVFNGEGGVRYSGSAQYLPGTDDSTVDIPLTAQGVAPATPTGLIATGENDRIVLRWNPDPNLVPGGNGTPVVPARYSVQRRATTAEGPFAEIAVVDAPDFGDPLPETLSFSDTNVRNGVRYFYQVVGISAQDVPSLPSTVASAVAGVGEIQVITPQNNQGFGVTVAEDGRSWQSQIDFAWVAVPEAQRYVFEIGNDPEMNQLLENGNEIIAASDQPTANYTIGGPSLPEGFVFGGGTTPVTYYWRVQAVDDENRIINQTEGRRFVVFEPGVVADPNP